MAKLLFLETEWGGEGHIKCDLLYSSCLVINDTYPTFFGTATGIAKIAREAGHDVMEIYQPYTDDALAAIQSFQPDFIWFVGHGSWCSTSLEQEDFWMSKESNMHWSCATDKNLGSCNGAIVNALSCLTGNQLGEAVVNNGARNYLGYDVSYSFYIYTGDPCDYPCIDGFVTSFMEPNHYFTIGMINGMTAGDAHNYAISRFNEFIDYWEDSSDPYRDAFIDTIINNRDGQILFGDPSNTLGGATPCEDITGSIECVDSGCYWYNGGCHGSPPTCDILNNRGDCSTYNCYWYNGGCHGSPPTCDILNNRGDCSTYNCYWYDNSCHHDPNIIKSSNTWLIFIPLIGLTLFGGLWGAGVKQKNDMDFIPYENPGHPKDLK